jgi:CheY-like chemotaxis protein/anti-sigma regulatory factor (Ser/Thr protein kinase)
VAQARSIALAFEPSSHLPQVLADRKQMAAVLNNLLANALSYTREGGIVRVATSLDGESVHLIVHDTGYGIAPEEMDHIFEKFYRGQAAMAVGAAGAGLGLSIVKQILELHQGTIGVTSKVGQGTTFTITLPVAEQPPGASPVILLIAENADDLSATQEQLAAVGYWVIPAMSETDALAQLAKETPDLIVLDLSSPWPEGTDLLEKLGGARVDPDPPILLLTASDRAPVSPPLALREDRVLAKPASKAALLYTVRRLLGRSEKPQG